MVNQRVLGLGCLKNGLIRATPPNEAGQSIIWQFMTDLRLRIISFLGNSSQLCIMIEAKKPPLSTPSA